MLKKQPSWKMSFTEGRQPDFPPRCHSHSYDASLQSSWDRKSFPIRQTPPGNVALRQVSHYLLGATWSISVEGKEAASCCHRAGPLKVIAVLSTDQRIHLGTLRAAAGGAGG